MTSRCNFASLNHCDVEHVLQLIETSENRSNGWHGGNPSPHYSQMGTWYPVIVWIEQPFRATNNRI
jgi:hypothetical protein